MKLKIFYIITVLMTANISLVKSQIKQPDTYAYTRGVEAFEEEKYADALDWFNRELSEHSDNGYAYVYVSILRHGNQEYGKALSAIDRALKHLPKKDKEWYSVALALRAKLYTVLQDTTKAIADLAQAIKIEPTNPKYYNARAELNYELKNYALADADYQKMISLDQGNVMGYMGIGRNANAESRWDDAIDQFNHVIKLAPDYSLGYSFRADSYIGKNMWAEATDDIVKALDIDCDNKAFYLMQNLPKEASVLLKSKLKMQMAKQMTNQYWPCCLAIIAQSEEEYANAISYYQKANALDANSLFLENISKCYMMQQDYQNALDYAERALSMSPEDYDVIDLKADILSGLGRFDECIAERDKYVTKYPELPSAYLSRANDLLSIRRYNDAVEDYNAAIILDPKLAEYPYLLMRRGDAYRLLGKEVEAKADYEKLLEVEKDSVLNSEAWTPFAYSGLGNAEKAIETMQYIVNNDTTDRNGSLYNMACLYARLGQKESAIKYLHDALENGYSHIAHIKTDYDLDCLREMPEYKILIDEYLKETKAVNGSANTHAEEQTENVEVPFTKDGDITKVKCTINGLPLYFVFDTGAADVTMSIVEANFMLKNAYIKPTDIIGSARYMDANGDIIEGTVVNLLTVNIGGLELENVRAAVIRNQKAPLLLGQSVLGRLGKIEIDTYGQKLVITHKISK